MDGGVMHLKDDEGTFRVEGCPGGGVASLGGDEGTHEVGSSFVSEEEDLEALDHTEDA